MIDVTIGGKTVSVGPLTYASLEASWAFITSLSTPDLDRFNRTTAHLSIIASYTLLADLPAEQERPSDRMIAAQVTAWKRALTWPEIMALDGKIVEILHLSGFKPQDNPEGEAAAAKSSAVTSSQSSPSSPPEGSREEALPASIAA